MAAITEQAAQAARQRQQRAQSCRAVIGTTEGREERQMHSRERQGERG
jgi:hypothetical protein